MRFRRAREHDERGSCRPVSRVLSSVATRTVIPLGARSPAPSSSLPAASWSGWATPRCLFGLAPAGVCHAAAVTSRAVGSYPTVSPLPELRRTGAIGGLFSVALSVGALRHRPGVTWQRALRSPDFPRALACPRPSGRQHPPRKIISSCPSRPDDGRVTAQNTLTMHSSGATPRHPTPGSS